MCPALSTIFNVKLCSPSLKVDEVILQLAPAKILALTPNEILFSS